MDLKYIEMSKVMKAVSNPTRLMILDKLLDEPHCVCQLTEMTDLAVSTVSRHLLVLKNCDLVKIKKVKNHIYYSIKCRKVASLIDCARHIVSKEHNENE